jgi:hypothetical protein
MPDEFDHEVIDSPQALFRHLYEAHGLAEALDLDPDTAPLQFWLRRHTELERAATRAPAQDRITPAQDHTAPADGRIVADRDRMAPARDRVAAARAGMAAFPVVRASTGRGPTSPSASSASAERSPAVGRSPAPERSPSGGRSPAAERPAPSARHAAPDRPASTGRLPAPDRLAQAGPRFRPFADPLVEALAIALVERGLEEREVRRGLSTFTGADGHHGEEAVWAAFIAPMLEAVAAYLAGDPWRGGRRTQPPPGPPSEPVPWERAASQPAPWGPEPTEPVQAVGPGPPEPVQAVGPAARGAAEREPAAARAEPAAAGQETWVAQPSATRGAGPEPEVDFMAIADVLQERRRSRRSRRDSTSPPRATPAGSPPPGGTPSVASPPSPQEPDDDYMALADALQRRRGGHPH